MDRTLLVVAWMTGTQMGKTELIWNTLGAILADRPRPCLYVGPTEDLIRSAAKDRWQEMVRSTPVLRAGLDPRAGRTTDTETWINGARCGFAWAGSGAQLRMHPCAWAALDEIDEYTPIPGQGDQITLTEARVSNYHGSLGLFSTPLLEETSKILRWFHRGTMERWSLLCGDCSRWFTPMIDLLRWPKGARGREFRQARLHCRYCDAPYDDRQRRELPARYIAHERIDGEYRPLEERPELSVRSFWVSGLCSAFRPLWISAEQLATAFRSGDPAEVQAKTNTVGGEPYGLSGDSPGIAAVKDKIGAYTRPAGVRLVTVGVDVQEQSLYYVIRGWGYAGESWLADYGQLWGPTDQDEVWLDLETIITREHFGRLAKLALVDSGYRPEAVHRFCKRVRICSPSKGHDTLAKPFYDALIEESAHGRVKKTGLRLWHINTDWAKSWVYARIRWPAGKPGDWHIPEGVTDDYCAQVTNEIRCVVGTKIVWRRTGNRENHFLDCEAGAAVAAHINNVIALPKPRAEDETPPPPRTPPSSPGYPGFAESFKRRD